MAGKQNVGIEHKLRLQQLLEYLGVSGLKLAQQTKIAQSEISKIQNSVRPISVNIAAKISKYHTQINFDWLAYGTGEMLKFEKKEEKNILRDSTNFTFNLRKILNQFNIEPTFSPLISPTTITDWLNGDGEPDLPTLIHLREALNVSLDDLLFADLSSETSMIVNLNEEKTRKEEIRQQRDAVQSLQKTVEMILKKLEEQEARLIKSEQSQTDKNK